jgi:hypothetical protein
MLKKALQLPEKYKENFDVSSAKALRLELLAHPNISSPVYKPTIFTNAQAIKA